jgi:hypothetical protein
MKVLRKIFHAGANKPEISARGTLASEGADDKCAGSSGVTVRRDLVRCKPSQLRLVLRQPENALHIPRGMENANDLQWLGFVPVNDQVRIDQKETMPFVG